MVSWSRTAVIVLCAALLAAVFAGCGNQRANNAGGFDLLVSRELQGQSAAISAAFSKANGGTRLNTVVLPADELRQKIVDGKLDGVLLSLGPKDLVPIDRANRLAQGGDVILGDVPLVVIVNGCGLCTFDGIPHSIEQKKITSIAIGDLDSGAVGEETMNALTKAKLWGKIKSKVVRMPLDKLVDAVASKKVSAAIVSLNQVNGSSSVRVGCYIDEKLHQPIQLLAVRTSGTRLSGTVSRFIEFLQTKDATSPLYDTGMVQHKTVKLSGNSLFLYCGAGLREATTKLISAFRKKTGVTIFPTYTGSGCLLAQITIGQSGDLYMPGEDWYMKQAEDRGYVTDSKVVTYMIPVIVVKKGNPKGIHGLKDLLKPGVRVGIGQPKACAIGDFTVKLMGASGIPMDSLMKNVAATFGTAPELGNSVKLGAVDAAIQWDAVAAWYLDDVDVVPFATNAKTISPVPLGVLKFSKHPAESAAFLDFVAGSEGRAIFEKAGYTTDAAHPRFPIAKSASR